ncbi:cytochrome P450 4c3-like isoform X2 [Tigriopus californicus]|nr:cytochrome P450 4c3-like isoform X2 [Tigriopus californicus]
MLILSLLVLAITGVTIQVLLHYLKLLLYTRRFPKAGLIYPLIGNANKLYDVPPEEILPVILKLAMKTDLRKMAAALGTKSIMMVFHPETTEAILSSNLHIGKSVEYDPLNDWLGGGLLLSKGAKWKSRRKMLTPAFHFRILEDAMITFNKYANNLTQSLLADGDCGRASLDIFPFMAKCTLDIILESAMGTGWFIQSQKSMDYPQVVNAMLRLIQHRQRSPWLMPDILFNLSPWKRKSDEYLSVLHGFSRSVIEQRRNEMKNSKSNDLGKRTAFLDLLLQARTSEGQELSNSDIQEEVDTFMFEGHDTTACALSWTILLLANHPEEQDRLYEEQIDIFGQENIDGLIENHHLNQMKHLEYCIKEALRLYPSVPVYGRTLESDVKLDGEIVPKGTDFLVISYLLHRNPLIWDRPNDFLPRRFSSDFSSGSSSTTTTTTNKNNSNNNNNNIEPKSLHRSPYAYVPFSAGPRNCIGQRFAMMEEKAILSTLVRKIKFVAIDRVEDVKPVIEIVTRPHRGIHVQCVPR